MLLLWLSGEDRDSKANRELNIVLGDASRNDISLLALDHGLDTLEGLWRVKQDLGQREVIRESINVLRHHKVDTLVSTFDVTDFEDFSVVAEDVRGHLKGRDVDDVDVWVLGGENSTDLGVLSLKELVH